VNLLTETRREIEAFERTPADVVFIGSLASGHRCTWDEFVRLADFDYDDGYGAQEVASDLVIVFRDGSLLQRHEYGGSEGWEFVSTTIPAESRPIRTLGGPEVAWSTLAELNQEEQS